MYILSSHVFSIPLDGYNKCCFFVFRAKEMYKLFKSRVSTRFLTFGGRFAAEGILIMLMASISMHRSTEATGHDTTTQSSGVVVAAGLA